MRIVALLIVVAIVYLVIARRSPVAPAVDLGEAKENAPVAASTQPNRTVYPPAAAKAPAGQPAQPSSGLRQPLDRTRSVLDQVKGRNGNGEF